MHTIEYPTEKSCLVRAPSIMDAIEEWGKVATRAIYEPNTNNWGYGDIYVSSNSTVEKMVKVFSNPNPRLVASIQELTALLKDTPTFKKQAPRRIRLRGQEYGSEVNVDRYLNGDSAWERMTKEQRPNKIITISLDLTRHLGEGGGWAGAAMCAVTEWLQGNGYKVAMNVFDWTIGQLSGQHPTGYSSLDRDWYATVVEVKAPNMSVDYGNLISIMDYNLVGPLFTRYPLCCHKVFAPYTGAVNGDPSVFVKSVGIDYFVPKSVSTRKSAEAWLAEVVGKQLGSER